MKVIFINCFSISDFAYLKIFFMGNHISGYNVVWTEMKNFDIKLADNILSDTKINLVIDRDFKNISSKNLLLLKVLFEKLSFNYKIITLIKNQFEQQLEQQRINVLSHTKNIGFLESPQLNKARLEYGQLFHLNEIFKDKNVVYSVDALKKKNINLVSLLIPKLNKVVFNYSKFTIISFDWYCFLFRVSNLINSNKLFRKKIEDNILSGKYSGEIFYFEEEYNKRNSFSDFFSKRNSRINQKFNANLIDFFETSNNLVDKSEFYSKDLLCYVDNKKVKFLSSLLIDGEGLIDKSKASLLSKAIADISYEDYSTFSFNIDFSELRLKPLKYEVLKHEKIFKNRGFRSDYISQIMKYVILCRRGIDVECSFFILNKIVKENIEELISTFNIRYLICIVDTYVDFGDDSEKTDFLFISQFVTNMKLIETISSKVGDVHCQKRIMTDGTDPYSLKTGDAFSNLFRRFYVNSKSSLGKLILSEILKKYSESENDLTREIFENPNIKNILKSKEFYET